MLRLRFSAEMEVQWDGWADCGKMCAPVAMQARVKVRERERERERWGGQGKRRGERKEV